MALEAQSVATARRQAVARLDDARRELDAAQAVVSGLPRASDAAPLRAAIERVRRHGDFETQLGRLTDERVRLQVTAERKLALLGRWSGSLTDVPSLPVPSVETVVAHEQVFAELERDGHKLGLERTRVAERTNQIATALDVLRREGAPPMEEDLTAARAARTAAWAISAAVRREPSKSTPAKSRSRRPTRSRTGFGARRLP